ncbi:mechanosensitive ion channel family protein [Thalassospira alkalitolerans]|uniref:mechanosensitive ion channel family protein n=1 Tax=Thalassospira alkalitolerans TaxID=1293890 RepID=UPI003AA7E51A
MKITTRILICLGLWLLLLPSLVALPGINNPAQAQAALMQAITNQNDTSSVPPNETVFQTADNAFSYYQFLDAGVARTRNRIAETLEGLKAFPDELAQTREFMASDFGRNGLMRIVLFTAIFVGAGLILEFFYRRATTPLCAYLESQNPTRFTDRLRQMAILCILSLLSLTVFAIGSIGTFMIFDWVPIMKAAMLSMLGAFFVLRIIMIALQFLFAPRAEGLRMINVDPQSAATLTRTLSIASGVSLFAFALAGVFRQAPPIIRGDIVLFDIAVIIGVLAFCVAAVSLGRYFANHQTANDVEKLALPTSIARLWPIIVCVYLIALGATAMLAADRIMKGLLAIGIACLFDVIIRNIIESNHRKKTKLAEAKAAEINARAAAIAIEEEEEFKPVPPEIPVLTPVLKRGVRLLALVFVLASFWRIWGLDRLALAEDAGIIARAIDASTEIIMIVLIADLLWSLIKAVLDERMNSQTGSTASHANGEGGGTGLSRVQTLLPLLKNFALTVILIMVIMVTLSSLGVDIGPLIAGAGVVGLAIGFGSQALVRDVVAGVFFLLDDAFRIGEYIEVENLRGRVENISIRSMQLRHHRGPLQTVPFGEIKSIINHSRDWVIVKLEFRVPFETDVNKIKKLVKKLSADLLTDPLIGHSFIEPLKSQGVRRMEEFNMVIGLKYTSKPGEQFTIRKTVYESVLEMFKENGIHMASRNVKVDVPADATPEQKHDAIAAGAQQASEQLAPPKDS